MGCITGEGMRSFLLASVYVISGGIYPVLARIMFTNKFPWKYNLELEFRKPLFHVVLYFLVPFLFIIPYVLTKRESSRRSLTIGQIFRKCSIPAILNIFATVCDFYSLIYVPVVVWQSFQGWKLLFSCVYSMTYSRRPLYLSEWIGLLFVIIGISFCGVSSLIRSVVNNPDETSAVFYGFIVMMISSGVRSVQSGYEERMYSMEIRCIEMTSFQGIWGVVIMGLIVVPLANIVYIEDSFYENTREIPEFYKHSGILVVCEIIFTIACGISAYFSAYFTKTLSSQKKFAIESFRPAIVLIFSCIVYYLSGLCEGIDRFSIGEMIGIVLLFIGTLISMQIVKFPCFNYSEVHNNDSQIDIREAYLLT